MRNLDEEELLRQYLSSTSSTPDAKTLSGQIIKLYRELKRQGGDPGKDLIAYRLNHGGFDGAVLGPLPALLAHALRGEKEEMLKYI